MIIPKGTFALEFFKRHNLNMILRTDNVNKQADIFNANFINCLNDSMLLKRLRDHLHHG